MGEGSLNAAQPNSKTALKVLQSNKPIRRRWHCKFNPNTPKWNVLRIAWKT